MAKKSKLKFTYKVPSSASTITTPLVPQSTNSRVITPAIVKKQVEPKRKLQMPVVKELPQGITASNTAQAIDVARNKKRYPNESLQTNTLRNQASRVQSQATSSLMAGLDPTGISSLTDMLAYGVQLPQDASGAIPINTAKKAGNAIIDMGVGATKRQAVNALKFGSVVKGLPFLGKAADLADAYTQFKQADSMYSKAAEIDSTQKSLRDKMEQKFRDGGYTGKATTSDSLALYNNAEAKTKFYKNNSDYKDITGTDPGTNFKDPKIRQTLIKYADKYSKYADFNKVTQPYINEVIETVNYDGKPLNAKEKATLQKSLGTLKFGRLPGTNLSILGDVRLNSGDTWYNPTAPPIYIHPNIEPQGSTTYFSKRYSDRSDIPYYDPIVIKPAYLKTAADYEYVKKKYPKLYKGSPKPSTPSTVKPKTTSTPTSKPFDPQQSLRNTAPDYTQMTSDLKEKQSEAQYQTPPRTLPAEQPYDKSNDGQVIYYKPGQRENAQTTPFVGGQNANNYIMGKYKNGGPMSTSQRIRLNLPVYKEPEMKPLQFNRFFVKGKTDDNAQNLYIGGVNPRYQNKDFSVGPYMVGVGNGNFQKVPAAMGVSGTYHVNNNLDINSSVGPNNMSAGIKYKFDNGGALDPSNEAMSKVLAFRNQTMQRNSNELAMSSNRVVDNMYNTQSTRREFELGGYVRNLGIINDERNWLTPKPPPVSNKKSMGVDVYGVSAGNVKFGIGGDTEGEEEKDFRDNINGFAQNSGEEKDKNNLFKDTTNGQLSDGLGMAASLASSVMPLSDAGQYGRYDVTDRGKMGISSALQGASMGAKLGPAGAVVGAVVGGVAGVVMAKKRERDKAKQVAKDQAAYQDRAASTLNFNNNVGVDNTAMYADGGLMKRPLAAAMMNRQNSNMKPMSENATEVKGRSHAEGGESLPDLGAEVEAGETTEGSYVFSKKLGFADLHRPLARAMGKIEKKPMTPDRVNALRLLQGKVEMLKAQQEQVRKQLNLA